MALSIGTRLGAVVILSTILVGGCSKGEPQKTVEFHESSAAAPQPPPPPAPVEAKIDKGERLFKQHCAVCHPNGGNIVKPEFTLHKKALAEHNIRKPGDIVKIMRNPGQGMLKFDEKTVPKDDALAIAKYVLGTFK